MTIKHTLIQNILIADNSHSFFLSSNLIPARIVLTQLSFPHWRRDIIICNSPKYQGVVASLCCCCCSKWQHSLLLLPPPPGLRATHIKVLLVDNLLCHPLLVNLDLGPLWSPCYSSTVSMDKDSQHPELEGHAPPGSPHTRETGQHSRDVKPAREGSTWGCTTTTAQSGTRTAGHNFVTSLSVATQW